MERSSDPHFSRNGIYMERFGAVGRAAPHSNMKVCFVATDREFLAGLLLELAARPDCFYVKYSIEPRDGMYLGRCFLLTNGASAKLCAAHKGHPRLMTCLQDDDFFNPFRE